MKVTLKTLQQQTFTVEIEDGWKVKDLKQEIEKIKGSAFPVEGQKLIFAGKILQDDTNLSEYTFQENSFIVIMAKPKPKAAAAPAPQEPSPARPAEPTPAATPAPEPIAPTTESQPRSGGSQPQPSSETSGSTTTDGGPSQPAAPALPDLSMAIVRESEELVEQISQMGFDVADIRRALRASFNNPDRAVEYLMTGIPESAQADVAMGAGLAGAPQAPGAAPAAPAGDAPAGGAPATVSPGSPAQPPTFGALPEGSSSLAALRSMPQFESVRQVIRQHPQMLPELLRQIGSQNPTLLALISQNQQEFINMMNEPDDTSSGGGQRAPVDPSQLLSGAGGQGGEPGQPGQPGGDGYNVMYVTPEEKAAIERLKAMGFDEHKVVEAYFACEKDEALAANYLLQDAYGD